MTKPRVGANLWYVQYGDEIKGPLPAKLITRYLILGRINLSTPVSQDRIDWSPVSDFPALIPDELLTADTETFARERIEAARRWEDERGDRADESYAAGHAERREPEAHGMEPDTRETRRHSFRTSVTAEEKLKERRFALASVIAILLLFGGLTAVAINEAWIADPGLRDCGIAPAPGVQWNHCSRRGAALAGVDLTDASMMSMDLTSAGLQAATLTRANLSYATLMGASLAGSRLDQANMVGTDLRDADLSGASLRATNLSYADLRGAHITDADFADAVLDRAIWLDGRICGDQSHGECRLTDKAPVITDDHDMH